MEQLKCPEMIKDIKDLRKIGISPSVADLVEYYNESPAEDRNSYGVIVCLLDIIDYMRERVVYCDCERFK